MVNRNEPGLTIPEQSEHKGISSLKKVSVEQGNVQHMKSFRKVR